MKCAHAMRLWLCWGYIALVATVQAAMAQPLPPLASQPITQPITIGWFAPSLPYASSAARVAAADQLATHVGAAIGAKVTGRVFSRAGDFASAVRKGQLAYVVVDVAYWAQAGLGGKVVALATRGDNGAVAWQMLGRRADAMALRGKRIGVPQLGGQEREFVARALFAGEMPSDFWAGLEAAPDTASVLAAMQLGKFDGALVPMDAAVPAGFVRVLVLPAVPSIAVVAVAASPSSASVEARRQMAAALAQFASDAVVVGFVAQSDNSAVAMMLRRYVVVAKRAILAVPVLRSMATLLLDVAPYRIEPVHALNYVTASE